MISLTGAVIAASPPLAVVGLLHYEAFRLYQTLGRWPSYGEELSPTALIALHHVVDQAVALLSMSIMFFVPVAMLVCALIRRWRPAIPYFALHVACSVLAGLSILTLPHQFVTWWLD